MGLRDSMAVSGSDYPTPDGTCPETTYMLSILLMHVKARNFEFGLCTFEPRYRPPLFVKEVLGEFEAVTGRSPQVIFDSRREGDVGKLGRSDGSKQAFGLEGKASVT